MENKKEKFLAIVPAFNEQGAIGSVVKEILGINLPVDVVVIDDGSKDRTGEAACKSGAEVIRLPINLGIGGAVQTGFKYAVINDYDFAVQVDGDGQHIAAEISKLVKALKEDSADVVIGSRFLEKQGFKSSKARQIGITMFKIVNSLFIRQKITDNTSGFRAYNKRAILFLSENYPCDYPEPESVVILKKNGFKLVEVPVKMREREHGESSISSFKAVYYMVKVFLAIFVDLFKAKKDKIPE